MAKIIGINNTSYRSFGLHEYVGAQLTGLLKSAGEKFDSDVATLSDRVDTLFGIDSIDFSPGGLVTNTASKLKYMISGQANDGSLGFIEVKGAGLPTYDTARSVWSKPANTLSMSYIGYTNASDTVNGEKFSIEGALVISHPSVQGLSTDKMDLSISKISIGNSDLTISLLANKLRIVSQQFSDGRQIGDPIVSGTIKGLQIDISNDNGIYDHASLGFTIGASTNGSSPYLILNTISITEDGSKSPIFSISDTGVKIQEVNGSSVVTRGSATWNEEDNLWDFLFGGADSIQGTSENDSLDGGSGKDTLIGMDGDDTYYVDNFGDSVVEKSGEGYDVIISSAQIYTISPNVERLSLAYESDVNFSHQDAVGNAVKNILEGNDYSNYIYGKDGNDTLTGGYGDDQFYFDTKPNAFTNVDVITDFVPFEDKMVLSSKFYRQSSGAGKADFFSVLGVDSINKDTRIIYDQNKGFLYYDADGNKSTYKPVLFAKLLGVPELDGSSDSSYFSFVS